MLIAGRGLSWFISPFVERVLTFVVQALQGFGGGGCIAVTEIIYADLVPLTERGFFLGINATYVPSILDDFPVLNLLSVFGPFPGNERLVLGL